MALQFKPIVAEDAFTESGVCTTCGKQGALAPGIGWYCSGDCDNTIDLASLVDHAATGISNQWDNFSADVHAELLFRHYEEPGQYEGPEESIDDLKCSIIDRVEKGSPMDVVILAMRWWHKVHS